MESITQSLQSKEGQPPVAIDDSHKKCKCKVWIILLCAVAICGVAFGIYGMFFANQKSVGSEDDSEGSVDTVASNIAAAYESRDLREKTLRLLGKRNGFLANYIPKEDTFIVLDDYVRQKSAGIAEPVFDPSILPTQNGIYAWQEKNMGNNDKN